MNQIQIHLNELKDATSAISPVQCDYFVEACVVALENQGHQSPVSIKVEGDFDKTFELTWAGDVKKEGWREDRISVENGSIAVAFFLILELTDYQIAQQSIIGTGFDYWLGFKESHPNYDSDNFLNAKLEVSGINRGSQSVIQQRVRQKLRQVGLSEGENIPAFIIVTEFGTPKSIIIQI